MLFGFPRSGHVCDTSHRRLESSGLGSCRRPRWSQRIAEIQATTDVRRLRQCCHSSLLHTASAEAAQFTYIVGLALETGGPAARPVRQPDLPPAQTWEQARALVARLRESVSALGGATVGVGLSAGNAVTGYRAGAVLGDSVVGFGALRERPRRWVAYLVDFAYHLPSIASMVDPQHRIVLGSADPRICCCPWSIFCSCDVIVSRALEESSMWMSLKRTVAFRLLAICVTLLLTSGCSAFRADVGFGFGIGAQVKIPAVAHVGMFHIGFFKFAGHNYDEGFRAGGPWELEINLLVHADSEKRSMTDESAPKNEHFCVSFLPIVMDAINDDSIEHSTGFEIQLNAVFFSIYLGFNPYYWGGS